MSNFPDEIYVKSSQLYDGHTRKPENTFAGSMYVMVNPWNDFSWSDHPKYIRSDLFYALEKQNQQLKDFALELMFVLDNYASASLDENCYIVVSDKKSPLGAMARAAQQLPMWKELRGDK